MELKKIVFFWLPLRWDIVQLSDLSLYYLTETRNTFKWNLNGSVKWYHQGSGTNSDY